MIVAPPPRSLALLASVVFALAAHADAPSLTRPVELLGCEGLLSPAALEEALGIELGGVEPEVRDYILRARPEARLRCTGNEIVVEVIADDGVALNESLHTAGLGLTRFVAIAIVESIAARAITRPPRPVPPAPPPPPPKPIPRRGLDAWLSLGGGFSTGGTPTWGGGAGALALELVVRELVSVHLDFTFGGGTLEVVPGKIVALQPSAGLGVRLGVGRRWFRFDGGVSLRVGAAMWSGQPIASGVTGKSGAAPWLGPAADVVFAADVSRRVRVRLHVEVGVPVVSASAEGLGMQLARLDPIWILGGLELAVRVTR